MPLFLLFDPNHPLELGFCGLHLNRTLRISNVWQQRGYALSLSLSLSWEKIVILGNHCTVERVYVWVLNVRIFQDLNLDFLQLLFLDGCCIWFLSVLCLRSTCHLFLYVKLLRLGGSIYMLQFWGWVPAYDLCSALFRKNCVQFDVDRWVDGPCSIM